MQTPEIDFADMPQPTPSRPGRWRGVVRFYVGHEALPRVERCPGESDGSGAALIAGRALASRVCPPRQGSDLVVYAEPA
jgi:hypothetical protein